MRKEGDEEGHRYRGAGRIDERDRSVCLSPSLSLSLLLHELRGSEILNKNLLKLNCLN